jgi:hypothetical protein
MFARLILALLLAAFAFPASAPAACHDVPTTAATTTAAHAMPMALAMQHPTPIDPAPEHKATPPHGCIGCVPPSNWTAARILGAVPHAGVPPEARAAVLDVGGTIAPDLRPPRLA